MRNHEIYIPKTGGKKMENLLFSIPQIKVHCIRSKLCLIESLGNRLLLFTLIYIEPLGKKYIYFL